MTAPTTAIQMQTQDDLTLLFDSLTDLTLLQRSTLKERYRILMSEYRYRCLMYSILFYTLRLTMTVGSLAVPALLSLKAVTEGETVLYWFTWGLSLAVTTANGILTLFKLDKRFFLLHGVAERIRTETWQYLSLSGRYSGYYGRTKPSHRNQYIYFFSRMEKIRMKHVDEEYMRQTDFGESDKTQSHQNPPTGQSKHVLEREETIRDTIGANIPTPPDQAGLMKTPSQNRRESSSSIGSDETVVQITDAKEVSQVIEMPLFGPVRPAVSKPDTERTTVLSFAPKV